VAWDRTAVAASWTGGSDHEVDTAALDEVADDSVTDRVA
jgi:hypothetical protein